MTYVDYECDRLREQIDDVKSSVTFAYRQLQVLHRAFASLDENVPQYDPADGAYGYVALDVGDMLESVFELTEVLRNDPDYRHTELPFRPCAFVEIGCGTGRNVFLLKQIPDIRFDKIIGFDIAAPYIAFGKQLFSLEHDLFVEDCMNFDFGGFDVLQFYRPFIDEQKEIAFEQYLIDSMRRSAYVIGHSVVMLSDSPRLMEVGKSGRIWKRL